MSAQIPSQVDETTKKQCPHCQRTFSIAAAERHIPKCANSSHRPRPPPTKEEIEQRARQRKARIRLNSPRLSASRQILASGSTSRKVLSPQRERATVAQAIKVFDAEEHSEEEKKQVTAMVVNADKRQPAIIG